MESACMPFGRHMRAQAAVPGSRARVTRPALRLHRCKVTSHRRNAQAAASSTGDGGDDSGADGDVVPTQPGAPSGGEAPAVSAAPRSSVLGADWVRPTPGPGQLPGETPMRTWDRPAVTAQRKMAASRLWAAFFGVSLASGLALASAVRWRNFSGGQSLLPALQAPAHGAAVATQHTTRPWEPLGRALAPAAPPSSSRHVTSTSNSAQASGQASKVAAPQEGGVAKGPISMPPAPDDTAADPSAMEEPIGWLNASPAEADASEEWGDVPPPQSGAPGWLDSTESAEDDMKAEEQHRGEAAPPAAGAKPRLGAAGGKATSRGEGEDDGCPRIPANSPAAVAVLRATAAAQSAAADAANAAAQAATAAADASAAAARVEAGGGGSGFSTGDGDGATMPFDELDTNIVITATRMATHAAAVARDAAKAAANAAAAAVAAGGPCRGGGPRAGV